MEGKARLQEVQTCYQCRYGAEPNEMFVAWCHEASRELVEGLTLIPSWCPLPLFEKLFDDGGCDG
jgi:hypothetical protein